MTYSDDNRSAGRHVFPDLARAFALIGIALVNASVMSYPSMEGYTVGGVQSAFDRPVWFAVDALFLLKSYTLFSFMFGVGFAYQIQSAERRGVSFAANYWRRIFGLVAFGAVNIAFLFQGDILVMYAVLGSFLFLCRTASTSSLIGWGIVVYCVQALIVTGFATLIWFSSVYSPTELEAEGKAIQDMVSAAYQVFGEGSFAQSIRLRFEEWLGVITFGTLMQGVGAFAFFLLGLAAVRSDVIARPGAAFWRRARWHFLPIGLIVSSAGAFLIVTATGGVMAPRAMFGTALVSIGSPFSTAGYLGLIAKWSEAPDGPVKTFLARGGSASLTAYLMQGLLLSLVFNHYGLSYFGEFGAATVTLIAFGIALFTICFTSVWRCYFSRGPLEAILRRWTYWGSRS